MVRREADRRETHWSFLGRVPWDEAYRLQVATRAALRAGTGPERLLLLEHPPTYTLGRNARREDVVAPAEWLAERGIQVFETDRGGQVTYHGPGQLVGYPVLNLSPDRRDVRRYVHDLQAVLVATLATFGVRAEARHEQEAIGVWVGEAKIASLGVHLKRWITTHGFALNVTTDLDHFGGIVACGLHGVTMTSIARETGRQPSLEAVAERYRDAFAGGFGRRLVAAPELPAPEPAPPVSTAAP